ncbi:aspartyl-phosphate phosphatase Spo0E family protein [Bacillus sp. EB01]|uniref:aspartyl-phosphate phosphatase Spo0E family protein n=1 Tax=Bacillus sp. EB01 TaxID=1347086 RepID=UPI000AFE64DD|nr:aspartyl-phosphate phosphatase Spo0E family protein [Bacillus sp. EB01]
MNYQLTKLAQDIEMSRKEMVKLASNTPLTDRNVVEASAKLDNLLNTYHLLIAKKA